MNYFLRKTRRRYLAKPKEKLIVVDGYSFSLEKKFYGFVTFYEKAKKWEAFEIYTGRKLGEGATRREAITKAISYLESMGLDKIYSYAELLKSRGTPRGINSRALKLKGGCHA